MEISAIFPQRIKPLHHGAAYVRVEVSIFACFEHFSSFLVSIATSNLQSGLKIGLLAELHV